jgi:hypothetical protein
MYTWMSMPTIYIRKIDYNHWESAGVSDKDLKCKHRCINFWKVTDPRRVLRPAMGGTGISNDGSMRRKWVIVISLGTPQSARRHCGYTLELLGVLAKSLAADLSRLGGPITNLWLPTTRLGAPWITGVQSWNHIIFGTSAGAPGIHSYYLSFHNF